MSWREMLAVGTVLASGLCALSLLAALLLGSRGDESRHAHCRHPRMCRADLDGYCAECHSRLYP